MKCKSCGADYKLKDKECPYCGSQNQLGKYWSRQERKAQKDYEGIKKDVIVSGSIYVINKILNAVIGGMIALFVISIVIVGATSLIGEKLGEVKKSKVSSEQMQTLHASNQYRELYDYMSEYDVLHEEAYTVYAEAAFMSKRWEEFEDKRMRFFETDEEDFASDSKYGIVYGVMDEASEIVRKEWSSSHKEVSPENQEYYSGLCAEVDAFLIGELGMTAGETRMFREIESYMDEWRALQRSIYRRNGWEWEAEDE